MRARVPWLPLVLATRQTPIQSVKPEPCWTVYPEVHWHSRGAPGADRRSASEWWSGEGRVFRGVRSCAGALQSGWPAVFRR